MTTASSSPKQTLPPDTPAKQNDLTSIELSFIMLILKQLSDKDHPFSASEIAKKMNHLTGEPHTEKTISRKLNIIRNLQTNPDKKYLCNILHLTYGGCIVEVSNLDNKRSTAKKKQSKFYFKPLLTNADVDFICAAINSNRYFSESEKKYLTSREQTLSAIIKKDDAFYKFMDKEAISKQEAKEIRKKAAELIHLTVEKPSSSIPDFLKHINQLYHAIQNDYMISLIYGVYDSSPKNFRDISLHAKNNEKPYKLNPYAMLWNNGAFYLIATHKGHTNPVHFRVDRILSIEPLKTEDDATKFQKRAKRPTTLDPFFENEAPFEFLPEKYTATYPLMSIYDDTNYISCQLECTIATSSILIDTFGTSLSLRASTMPHSEDEVDFHGRPQKFLIAKISKVQYDNILQFCLQQHTSITAISPPQLVEDIQKNLEKSLNKSKRYQLAQTSEKTQKTTESL